MSERAGRPSEGHADTAPGKRLRMERERRGLSERKIAEELHVDVKVIEALEAGRFQSLGAPVYAKGHLRKYASLLGLDADALLEACEPDQVHAPDLVPLKPAPGQRRRRRRLPIKTIVAMFAVLVAAAVLYWVLRYRVFAEAPPPATAVSTPEMAAPAQAERDQSANADVGAPVVQAAAAPTTPAPSVKEPAHVDSAPVRLRISFAADSWVEVYDASDQRVFFDMGAAGSARSFSANAPLRVFLGFADGVQIELDGRAVALPVTVKRGNLAEFTLDAQGQVRPARAR